MTKDEFNTVFAIATSTQDLSGYDDSPLYEFGLREFQPVTVELQAAAKCLRWQCICFDGSVDVFGLNECARFFQRRVDVIVTVSATADRV